MVMVFMTIYMIHIGMIHSSGMQDGGGAIAGALGAHGMDLCGDGVILITGTVGVQWAGIMASQAQVVDIVWLATA